MLKKYEQERIKYIAKEWEEFNFVKEILVEKKSSKSSKYFHMNSTKKL